MVSNSRKVLSFILVLLIILCGLPQAVYGTGGSSSIIQADAGDTFTLILKDNGTVWAWGYNGYGQCGNGTTMFSEALTQVVGLTDVVKIAAGSGHCLAMKSDGTVWTWGYNNAGQLGDGTTTNRTAPIQVSGLTDVVGIAAGGNSSFALKANGTVWAWGNNGSGQLGIGSTTNRTTPVQIGLSGVACIAAGGSHSVMVKQFCNTTI